MHARQVFVKYHRIQFCDIQCLHASYFAKEAVCGLDLFSHRHLCFHKFYVYLSAAWWSQIRDLKFWTFGQAQAEASPRGSVNAADSKDALFLFLVA